MALPGNPPATTTPTAFKTWAQAVADTAADHDGRVDDLETDLPAHTGDTAGAHAASAISFTPAGTIAATDVQAAIVEVAAEAGGGGTVSDTAYAGSWDGVTTVAPSKNAVYDQMELRAPKASPTFTGTPVVPGYLPLAAAGASVEHVGAIESDVNTVATSGSTETLDTSLYGVHDVTMDQACTFTFSNPAPSGDATIFTLILRGAFTPTWPAAVDWPDATQPTYTTPAVYTFLTVNAGTTWLGMQAGKAFG